MKLLMISGDRSILEGKKGAFWYTLEEFAKHWERVDVITPKMNHESGIMNNDSKNVFPNVFFHSSPRKLWYQPWWILQKGYELFKAHHHDVMTVHEFPPFYNGIGARWLHRSTGIPYMTEIHHIVGYPRAASWKELIGRWLSMVWLPLFGTSRAAKVRVVNPSTKNTLELWGVPWKKLECIQSLYLDADALRSDPSIPKSYDVVFCGRLVANKGLSEVLWAVATLPGTRLLIIGDGPERALSEHVVQKLGIADRVTFAGWLPTQADVYRAIQQAKIFVMNSRSEGGPRVLFEAMALGMPVIATNVGLVPDLVQNGINGRITTGEVQDLAWKISELLSDEKQRISLGGHAAIIRSTYSRKTLVKNYADALKHLVSDTSYSG